MLHASTQKLIDKLCEMTAKRQIDWQEGEDGRTVFESEGYSVELFQDPLEIRLMHESGRELEKAGIEELRETPSEDDGSYEAVVSNLAMEAHRIAIGAEAAISSILSSLDTPRPVISAPRPSAPDPKPAETPAPGPTSEAEVAAAVADMAEKFNTSGSPSAEGAAAVVAADFSDRQHAASNDADLAAVEEDAELWASPPPANDQTEISASSNAPAQGPKVTSTGLAIGEGVGAFITGVPDDVETAAQARTKEAGETSPSDAPTKPYKPWS